MKSIMEEASSISKAIDQAWNRAGKPAEFTIKILELPERNLFGMTVKSAKVAFFFDEKKAVVEFGQTERKPRQTRPYRKEEPDRPTIKRDVRDELSSGRSRWNNDMMQLAIDWVKNVLHIMELPNITFTTSTSMNGLTFYFKNSITGSESKDRLLFSSFSHLILSTLRQKYKTAFKNLKVILITE